MATGGTSDIPVAEEAALTAVSHDKKSSAGTVDAVFVDRIGEFLLKKVTLNEISELLYNN